MVNVIKSGHTVEDSRGRHAAESTFVSMNSSVQMPRVRDMDLFRQFLASLKIINSSLNDNIGVPLELTLPDTFSTEGYLRSELEQMVENLLNKLISRDGRVLKNEKEKVRTEAAYINAIYQEALVQIAYLGYVPSKEQIDKKFSSKQDLVDFFDSIKPLPKTRPHETIMNCIVARMMDSVADVSMTERIEQLDHEAEMILKKIQSIDGIRLKPIGDTPEDEGKYSITYNPPNGGEGFFRGVFRLRKKHLRNILLKLTYNRKYDETALMNDLLGMRFEANEADVSLGRQYIENAINFFSTTIFHKETVELDQKWGLLSNRFLNSREIQVNKGAYHKKGNKTATSNSLRNADLTGSIPLHGVVSSWAKQQTGPVEMQFQYAGGMDNLNSAEIYDLQKFLSAASRDIPGISIGLLKFYIHLVGLDSDIPESVILNYLLYPRPEGRPLISSEEDMNDEDPPEGYDVLSPEEQQKKEEKDQKRSRRNAILDEKFPWHGFLLFMRGSKGDIRLSTTDIWSPDFERIYSDYPTPMESISLEEFRRAYDKFDVKPMLLWAHKERGWMNLPVKKRR